jgi:spermidine synthase
MAGLAIGGYVIGKYVDTVKKPLRLYGLLELGIALFAAIFIGFMNIYPSLYIPLAQGRDDSPLYLSSIRILFSIVALIVPTTLMGGTLPVLSRFISRRREKLRNHLSFLYGFNTFGAVLGATAAGFFLLRLYSVSTTFFIAITNASIALSAFSQDKRRHFAASHPIRRWHARSAPYSPDRTDNLPINWPLGIGASDLRLGYEVSDTDSHDVTMTLRLHHYAQGLTGIAWQRRHGLFPKIFLTRSWQIHTRSIVQVIIVSLHGDFLYP